MSPAASSSEVPIIPAGSPELTGQQAPSNADQWFQKLESALETGLKISVDALVSGAAKVTDAEQNMVRTLLQGMFNIYHDNILAPAEGTADEDHAYTEFQNKVVERVFYHGAQPTEHEREMRQLFDDLGLQPYSINRVVGVNLVKPKVKAKPQEDLTEMAKAEPAPLAVGTDVPEMAEPVSPPAAAVPAIPAATVGSAPGAPAAPPEPTAEAPEETSVEGERPITDEEITETQIPDALKEKLAEALDLTNVDLKKISFNTDGTGNAVSLVNFTFSGFGSFVVFISASAQPGEKADVTKIRQALIDSNVLDHPLTDKTKNTVLDALNRCFQIEPVTLPEPTAEAPEETKVEERPISDEDIQSGLSGDLLGDDPFANDVKITKIKYEIKNSSVFNVKFIGISVMNLAEISIDIGPAKIGYENRTALNRAVDDAKNESLEDAENIINAALNKLYKATPAPPNP
jgi:hypothetical protein